jgi:hypothetical protein
LRPLIDSGTKPGLLAYLAGEPVGWCAVAPRDEYARLQRSPVLKAVDDVTAWAIACFYITPARSSTSATNAVVTLSRSSRSARLPPMTA